LGIMRSFRVYKPAAADASFLEIQHFGTTFLSLIGNQISLLERQVQGKEKTQTEAKNQGKEEVKTETQTN